MCTFDHVAQQDIEMSWLIKKKERDLELEPGMTLDPLFTGNFTKIPTRGVTRF